MLIKPAAVIELLHGENRENVEQNIHAINEHQTLLLHENNIWALYQERNIKVGEKLLVLLSGWIDSTVLASMSKQCGEVYWLQFQRKDMPPIEVEIVDKVSQTLNIPVERVIYPDNQRESYALYMLLASHVWQRIGADSVLVWQVLTDWYNRGKAYISWSSWLVFNKYINEIIKLEAKGDQPISITSPLGFIAKKDVIQYWKDNNIPLHYTISCPMYHKLGRHCGECIQCQERRELLGDI